MLRALSTAACGFPADARVVLEQWRQLSGGRIGAVALDARLPQDLQAELLHGCRSAGLPCPEVTHSTAGWRGLRAASPISTDRDERAAAAAQLSATVRMAGESGAGRVLLLASRLPLSISRGALARRFALARDLGVDALADERAELAARALDGLSLVLDEVLPLCAQLSLRLLLPLPAPWPDQVPSLAEVGRMLELFRGAPLGTCFGSDWAAVAAPLAGEKEVLEARRSSGVACLRLADACGLRQRLPPGTGEVRFDRVLAGMLEVDQVLVAGPDVWPAEVARAVDLLDGITATITATAS